MSNQYQELGLSIKRMQKELTKLQDKLEQLSKAEKEETALPEEFEREHVLEFLRNPNYDSLNKGFRWISTPQGLDHWREVADDSDRDGFGLELEDRVQLQEWVIASFLQESR